MTLGRDEVAVVVLLASFAAWGVLHVLLVVGLARGSGFWRAPVALVVLPLAPYWGMKVGMRGRAIAWCFFGLTSVVTRLALAR